MKKSVLCFLAVMLLTLVVFTACGKKCLCTYYEDNKKIYVTENGDVRYFEKSLCEDKSVKPYSGNSVITSGKEVTKEVKCK